MSEQPLNARRPSSDTDTGTSRFSEFAALLAKLGDENSWMTKGNCYGMDIDPYDDPFFPPRTGSATFGKQICSTCPVQEECLEAGMSEVHGTWGGRSNEERRRLRNRTPATELADNARPNK